MRTGARWSSRLLLRLAPIASIASLLGLWAFAESRSLFLPSLGTVFSEAREMLGERDTYSELGASLQRLGIGIAVAVAAGWLLALAAQLNERLNRIVRIYMALLFGLPSLLVAFLSLVAFGISDTGVVAVVVIVVLPFVADPLLQALQTLDRHQLDMAKVFRVSRREVVRNVVLPHTAPYFFAALRNAHALGWKVLLVAEIFSVRSGLGYQFKNAFDFFRIGEALVWLVLLLAVIAILEYGVLGQIERRVFAWRTPRQ